MADKYYVVWKGRTPGVYTTWEKCKTEVSGYKSAEYKGYKTLGEAERAYKDEDVKFITNELGHDLTYVERTYIRDTTTADERYKREVLGEFVEPTREREVEQERERERKNAGACVSKKRSRPLQPDDPSKYTAATRAALERVLGKKGDK